MKHGIEINCAYHVTVRVQGYRGYVTCWENGRLLWRESVDIFRYCKEDAIEDAKRLRDEILAQNAMA